MTKANEAETRSRSQNFIEEGTERLIDEYLLPKLKLCKDMDFECCLLLIYEDTELPPEFNFEMVVRAASILKDKHTVTSYKVVQCGKMAYMFRYGEREKRYSIKEGAKMFIKEHLLPKLKEKLEKNGYVSIITFYEDSRLPKPFNLKMVKAAQKIVGKYNIETSMVVCAGKKGYRFKYVNEAFRENPKSQEA